MPLKRDPPVRLDAGGGYSRDIPGRDIGGGRGGGERGTRESVQATLNKVLAEGRVPVFPVGPPLDRRDIISTSSPIIPTVAGGVRELIDKDTLFGKGVRLPKTPNSTTILEGTKLGGGAFGDFIRGPQKVSTPTIVKNGTLPTTIEVEVMPTISDFFRDILPGDSDIFDLGADIYGVFNPPQTFQTFVPNQNPPAPPTNIPTTPSNGGSSVPGIDPGFPGTAITGCESDPRNQYVLKFLCGEWKWVKKRKRRRKRLATSSDIKDLSSLKGVLGSGKSFDLWIATHA